MLVATLCYYLNRVLKFFCELPDYYIYNVSMDYNASVLLSMDEVENISDAWKDQSYYWNDDSNIIPYHWDITRQCTSTNGGALRDILNSIPENVSNLVYTVKYSYNGKTYKYVSYSKEFHWPPPQCRMKFVQPITSVWGLDMYDKEVKEITKHFKKAAGPKGDFHGQDVKIMDIMKYDYSNINVKYIITSKKFNENDSVLSLIQA